MSYKCGMCVCVNVCGHAEFNDMILFDNIIGWCLTLLHVGHMINFVDASLPEIFHSISTFFTHFSKCIGAPTAAMVDSRCPLLLQAQFTGEEASDELEDSQGRRRATSLRIELREQPHHVSKDTEV